jgi:uncharacterized damage-inducible protein DinB
MTHLLVAQLRFTRSEWVRGLDGITDEEGARRLPPMNSISWMVGHLAWQEHNYWVRMAQGLDIAPKLDGLVASGQPAGDTELDEMWLTWSAVTRAADEYLDTLTEDMLTGALPHDPRPFTETRNIGSLLLRNIYHYWYHLGEALAVRQQFGHTGLPQFVGDMAQAAYRR